MSEEYYYIEEVTPNLSDVQNDRPKSYNKKKAINFKSIDSNHDVEKKKSQEIRLHEIEQQLKMAESRCSTLKGQVDYMKKLYNGINNESNVKLIKDVPKIRQPSPRRQLSIDMRNPKKKRFEKDASPAHHSKDAKYRSRTDEEVPSRDVDVNFKSINNGFTESRHECDISTKDASSAVKSINNIISGITSSVNRLTQLQVHIGSSTTFPTANETLGIQTIKCAPRDPNQNTQPEKPYQADHVPHRQSNSSIKSKTMNKKFRKPLKRGLTTKQSASKQGSTASINEAKKKLKVTAKHVEKKTKLNQPIPTVESGHLGLAKYKRKPFAKLKAVSSRTLYSKKSDRTSNGNTEKSNWKSDKLIELYHNSAIKMVTTSEDSLPKTKCERQTALEVRPQTTNVVQNQIQEIKVPATAVGYRNPLTPIEEQERMVYQQEGSFVRNYELPTIASKMKQVAKSYFENFSFRTIPFVAAKSITPSHNLGVNIQQVLSIIKGRKPVTGISPTLAYNIELAANKLGSRPLSALVSTLGSRMTSRTIHCPLSRRYPNYSHLQELAKNIPEETLEELAAVYDEENGSKVLAPEAILAAGDKHLPDKVWSTDPENVKEKCTCLSKHGVHFNEVYNKLVPEEKTMQKENLPNYSLSKKNRCKPWNTSQKLKQPTATGENLHADKSGQINQRERNLKEVLKNLHEDFAQLNERYDEIKNQITDGKESDSDLVHELEKLERELQNKEDEITMVMTLYKEVLALKQQVKVLKKRASQSSVVVSPYVRYQRDYREANAAGHLTKLLRHIQQFKETLNNKGQT